MQQYLARRLIYGVLTAVLVSLLVFALMRIAPGDVAQSIAAEQAGGEEGTVSEEQLEQIREALGLNRPLYIQYADWMGGFVIGDWGNSLFTKRPVFTEFKKKVVVTVELVIISQIIAIGIGLPAGVLMALKQDTRVDYTVRIASLAGCRYRRSGARFSSWWPGRTSSAGIRRWATWSSSTTRWGI